MIDDKPAPADRPPPTDSRRRERELLPRIATAAAAIPILVALILVGGPAYVAVASLLLAIGAGELCRAAGMRWTEPAALCAIVGAALLGAVADARPEARWAVLSALVAVSLAVAALQADIERGFSRWSATLAGGAYVGVLGGYLVLLRMLDDGRAWVLLMLFTTFATDTGAFIIGRTFGRRRLAPRVSPGKTVAGAVGGLIAGGIVAVALGALLALDAQPAALLGLGAATALAAETGDLAESLIKRALGVKDMGRLVPGHGGVLDRLDSVLFAAPVVYWIARWISA